MLKGRENSKPSGSILHFLRCKILTKKKNYFHGRCLNVSNKKHITAGPKPARERKLVLRCELMFTCMFSACTGAVNKPRAPGGQHLMCVAEKARCFLGICHRYLKVKKSPHGGWRGIIHGCVTFTCPCNTLSLKTKITRLKKK